MYTFLDWSVPPLAIVADKAYGSKKIRRQIADEGSLPKAMNGSQCLTTLTSIHKEISSNGSFAK